MSEPRDPAVGSHKASLGGRAAVRDRLFAFSELPTVSVAIEATAITEVRLSEKNAAHLDVALYLGVPFESEPRARRVVLVKTPEGPLFLRLGERFTMESVRVCDVFALPLLVAEVTMQLGLSAVIARRGGHEGVAFVLSPTQIRDHARRLGSFVGGDA